MGYFEHRLFTFKLLQCSLLSKKQLVLNQNFEMRYFKSFQLNPNKGDVPKALPEAGGAPRAPPIYLGSGANFCSKIMCP